MKVSVIIATYKREETLRKAISSVKNQSYEDIELIVVSDNANEEWNEKVRSIIGEFSDIIFIQNEKNEGSAETRNIGIRAASGEYVTFLDDDDQYLVDKIKNQVSFMVKNNLDISVTNLDLYYTDGKLCERRTRPELENIAREDLFKYHLMHHITGTDTMMFRRGYLLEIGGFAPINIGDEFYLMQRALLGGGEFGYLNESQVVALVHTNDEGLSSGQGKIDGENRLYQHKKQYFKTLDGKSRRYIKMRHYAVLAFCYKRQKKIFKFFIEGIKSFLSAPIACIKLLGTLK